MSSLVHPLVFDIETGPLPDEQLDQIVPTFTHNKTLKDPAKITADLAEKAAAWRERAALNALTGQVLAVVVEQQDTVDIVTSEDMDEVGMLNMFWDAWRDGGRMIGFNVKEFDMRFLVSRSRILGVPLPEDLFEGRYWNHRVVDLMEIWCCYSRDCAGQSLDAVCQACGLGKKTGNGADFSRLLVDDRPKAIVYMMQDIKLTVALAKRLGVL